MNYFLIVYDRAAGKLVDLQMYREDDLERASMERFNREMVMGDLEIVLLGADSIESLKKTHSRYFRSPKDLTGSVKLATA